MMKRIDTRKFAAGLIAAAAITLFPVLVKAQDTTKRKTINITSTFKPVLKDAAKINFNAAVPVTDTALPKLNYDIPSQYLFLTYQAQGLNPVALGRDTVKTFNNDNYVKVGVGNVHLPYLKAGFSFGDRKSTFFNVFAEGYSAKGRYNDFQKNSLANVYFAAAVKTKSNLEFTGKAGFRGDNYYLYGFEPQTLNYTKDDLKQRFQDIYGSVALRNLVPTDFGLTYHPNIAVSFFGDNHSPTGLEANQVVNLPLEKTVGEHFAIDLGVTADLTNYKRGSGSTETNNLYWVSPAVVYRSDNISVHAEVTPSWDHKAFHLLPNFTADFTTDDRRFTFFTGYTGRYEKGSYERFARINPWLAAPDPDSPGLLNTRVQEFFGGIKGSLGEHFSYLAKAGGSTYRNMPLFVNDLSDGKTFDVLFEEKMDVFRVHGEASYNQGEDFSATAGITLSNYKTKVQEKAWGMLPMELTANLRWQILKDLWLKADLLAFGAPRYRGSDRQARLGDNGLDVSAGLEFRILRQLNLWVQMNNIFNNEYMRWNQYPVYGFNLLGGVIFNFGRN